MHYFYRKIAKITSVGGSAIRPPMASSNPVTPLQKTGYATAYITDSQYVEGISSLLSLSAVTQA